MKPRDIEITLRVRTAAPLPVLRDPRAYSTQLIDQHFNCGDFAARYELKITRATTREIEPWEEEQGEMEFGGCS